MLLCSEYLKYRLVPDFQVSLVSPDLFCGESTWALCD